MTTRKRNTKRQGVSKNGRRTGHIIGTVYLLHFGRAYNGARHYLGFSTNVPARLKAHKARRGAPLVGAVAARGIGVRVVRQWRRKDGYFEQNLKRRFDLHSLCPVCKRGR
jgi:hypothetical protein